MRVSFVLRSIEIQPLFIDLYIFFIREEKEVGRCGRRGVGGEMGNNRGIDYYCLLLFI